MSHEVHSLEEKFVFTQSTKKILGIVVAVGLLLLIIGIFTTGPKHGEGAHAVALIINEQDSHSEGEYLLLQKKNSSEGQTHVSDHESEGKMHAEAGHDNNSGAAHGEFKWYKRFYVNLWINIVFFAGLSIVGVFFYAIQYVSSAGWSAAIKRIPMSFGSWLPIGGVLMLIVFLIAGHDIFHWTHVELYDKSSHLYDEIINGKKAFFFFPLTDNPSIPVLFLFRMVLFFSVWYIFYRALRNQALAEDLLADTKYYTKSVLLSALFIIFFAVSSSMSAWDWVMSIDTHWFSTMFGWYVFASWFVTGVSLITLIVVFLKEKGYLAIVNSSHLHDLGKFVFAFSIFWTYLWFSQFMLIFYANIPEESIYFLERLRSSTFAPIFFVNIILNFCLPFLLLMTRDAKRQMIFLKIVCSIVIVGHWLDFYLMITPGTLRENGGLGFMEIGTAVVFMGAFLYTVLTSLSRYALIPKNHPMLEESIHHHI